MNKIILKLGILLLMTSCQTINKSYNPQVVTLVNSGVGGHTTKNLLDRIDSDVINYHPDLTIVMVGTNDMLNSRKMISYEEYKQNLEQIIIKLKAEGSQVLLMSPPPADSAYLFERHDKTLYKDAPNVIMDSLSHIVEQTALDNKVLFFNINAMFQKMDLPKHNQDLYFRNVKNCGKGDGVHPTQLGYKLIADRVFEFLSENNLLKKFKTIVCFGDSITSGAGSVGGGTVTGKNYPSFLLQRIREIAD
ncbi:GDSL-type esterase/lipase family protein [Ancylomarina sp. 16SWW S1-10-2]|uniref:SGNH/GDSL hydrolase family protein n=1 Tax=Ancylomarina sp. 16SWW S1-10-2 TaxID=2499681 RepID=UPI00189F473F|nr:GDSL-type esterase/lipase family protein [Ancylomarina sp. 16SWW S1-10-2]